MKKYSYWILLVAVCVFLAIPFLKRLSIKEHFTSTKKHTFIHVPKTGGTSINKLLEREYPSHFDLYSNQYHNIVATKFNKPVLCIREPTDRFLSLHNYWSTFVNDHHEGVDTSLKNFISLMKQNSPTLLFGNPPVLSEYHYFKQSNYIDPSVYPYSVVLTYDKDKLESKVNALLNYLNISKKYNTLPKETVSKKTNETPDGDDLNFIKDRYYEDYLLWDKLNQNPGAFLKVF
jgi:hypothetical protein